MEAAECPEPSRPVLLVTCRSSSDLCEHEVGNVLFIKDPCVRVEKTRFPGVLLVYSVLDVNTAYRATTFREYGFVELIVPIHCTSTLPVTRPFLEECLSRLLREGGEVKVKVRARGVRGVSSEVYKLVLQVLRERGITTSSKSPLCLFLEIIESAVYLGVGSCKPVFKASTMNS